MIMARHINLAAKIRASQAELEPFWMLSFMSKRGHHYLYLMLFSPFAAIKKKTKRRLWTVRMTITKTRQCFSVQIYTSNIVPGKNSYWYFCSLATNCRTHGGLTLYRPYSIVSTKVPLFTMFLVDLKLLVILLTNSHALSHAIIILDHL